MDQKTKYKALSNFFKGEYSYNDYLKVRHWFTQVKEDKELENQFFDQWKEMSAQPLARSLRPVFEKIQYKILLSEKKSEQKRSLWGIYSQVAAVLVPLLILSAAVYFYSRPAPQQLVQSWVEINAPQGARIEFMLPDSTTGWLNSGAKLRYPSEFAQNRKVELTGEGFFDVMHREKSEFTVGVRDMDVKVLGTRFNVSAYDNDGITEVVLQEGKVEIMGKTAAFNQVLLPGEKISFNREKRSLNKLTVDSKIYTAWIDGYLVIDNEPLSIIAKKFERWYNVEITIEDEVLKNFRFKATFQDEPIEEILRFIAMTTPITYKIDTRGKDSNGVLTRKHVTIKRKQ